MAGDHVGQVAHHLEVVMTGGMYDVALDYLFQGWSVVPMDLRTKHPTVSWKEFQERTPTVPEITAWFGNGNPRGYGIGAITGAVSGLLVVDADHGPKRKKEGTRHVARGLTQAENLGLLEHPTRIHRTRSGGAHFLFRHPGVEIRNSASKLAPDIDIRGDGGFVVLPPSRGYRVHADVPIADCPQHLLAMLVDKHRPERPPIEARSYNGDGDGTTYGLKALQGELDALQGAAARNDQLNSSAFSLGQLVAGGELSESRVRQDLRQVAWGIGLGEDPNCGPRGIEGTIQSGLTSGMKEPRTSPAYKPVVLTGSSAVAPPAPSATASRSLDDVHEAFAAHLFLPDPLVVDVGLATYVAHRLPGDPLWVQLVGASGSGKTEVVQSLADIPEIHPLSKLTPQTFVSGFVGKTSRPASLLMRMQEQGRSFLTLKDFTTVLQMPRDARQEIVAQLRELYDGSYQADYGNGMSITWTGRLGFLAGVTPVVDSYRAVTSLLGERFVYYRLPPAPRAELSRSALKERNRRLAMREELRAHVRGFLEGLDYSAPPVLSPGAEERLVALADFTTLARSGVERDSGPTRDIIAMPEPEAPTRYVQQLAALTEALVVMGYSEGPALAVAVRVARDSIQSTRRQVLRALRENPEPNTSEVGRLTGLPTSTARLTLGDLTALGLAERLANEDSRVIPWRLSDRAASTWALADPEVWG